MGLTGVFIFAILVCVSVYAVTSVPLTSFREWNSPSYWVDYPASAAPSWTSIGIFGPRSPVHTILDSESADRKVSDDFYRGIRVDSYSFATTFDYDSYPTYFMIPYSVTYGAIPPFLEINVTRPDGRDFRIFYSSLPPNAGGDTAAQRSETSSRIFSTDKDITKNLRQDGSLFNYSPDVTRPQIMLFSDAEEQRVLKGKYTFKIAFYLFDSNDRVDAVRVIIGGTVYGFLGTDGFRRDLAIGMLWGTPVALFIGLSVAVATSVIAMIYGVNIFYIVLLLIMFGWAGGARLMRSLALQIKNFQYVEASKMMGESDFRIILRHIVPQLLPLTFASIAYAVPGAILAEAGLSFLGLSDLSIPTWGRILNEANSASAFTLGLWWWIVPPGLMIGITGLSFALIGYTLEYLTNPRRATQLKRS